ncbi:MAG TPA: 3-dehydroquinate synthase [Methylomirabilota bacterium]|nr:3-dehydroquinate synthase [Methylomirabilota bacterium]
MKKININLKEQQKSYSIYLGTNLIEKIAKLYDLTNISKIFVITDDTVAKIFLQELLANLPKETQSIILPTGENEKNIENAQKIWMAMYKAKLDRKSLVINLGGGVIGDIGGFTASTFMRGIPFINIPTTLLSQVDESVGGKTGINFAGIKNLIGTFTQPKAVIIDTAALKTLPKREFIAGFGEIIKHGLITDKKYFEKVTSKNPLKFSDEELVEIITGSCQIKKAIVQNDEMEKGKRKLLNFGHTIGHAIEALSLETDKPLLHGEAISIGIIAEAKLSEQVGLLSKEERILIENKVTTAGMVTRIQIDNPNGIFEKMKLDKKNTKGKINFTLLKKIGEAIQDHQVTTENILEAIKYIIIKQ